MYKEIICEIKIIKKIQKQPYYWVIRFTLVIIINNVCVSKYAYAAVTIFKWDTENIYISFTGTVCCQINLIMIKDKQYDKWR